MRKLFRFLIPLVGISLGVALVALLFTLLGLLGYELAGPYLWVAAGVYIFFGAVGLVLGIVFSDRLAAGFERLESKLRRIPIAEFIAGCAGLALGLFIAFMLTRLTEMIRFTWLSISLSILLYALCSYFFMHYFITRRHDLIQYFTRRQAAGNDPAPAQANPVMKLLDTSVIIDGRIYDICKTGFLEGTLVVPNFVLNELRAISDSQDDLKRSRGRRGLDVLARLQNELSRPVEILPTDYPDMPDVDEKLMRLALEKKALIITNDFNLNKVANVRHITVLNINELGNAVKPVVLPGEAMTVRIVKEGKEPGQGVAYLEDGTMIVVERAAGAIGQTLDIVVTSALQTAAGRMIFGKAAP